MRGGGGSAAGRAGPPGPSCRQQGISSLKLERKKEGKRGEKMERKNKSEREQGVISDLDKRSGVCCGGSCPPPGGPGLPLLGKSCHGGTGMENISFPSFNSFYFNFFPPFFFSPLFFFKFFSPAKIKALVNVFSPGSVTCLWSRATCVSPYSLQNLCEKGKSGVQWWSRQRSVQIKRGWFVG